MSNFERTDAGAKWADWMEKNIGRDFRAKILHGQNPFVQQETGNSMPKDIRHALRDFLRDENEKHKMQLEKYKSVYAAATSTLVENIKVSVRPYFKYP